MAEPMWKAPEIRKLQDRLSGSDVEGSIKSDVCSWCKGPAVEFDDELSRKEFRITGMCQTCQDDTFSEEEDDE